MEKESSLSEVLVLVHGKPITVEGLKKDVESLREIYPHGTERGSIGKNRKKIYWKNKVKLEPL